jgi:DNA end-binding protein Ku
VPEDKDAGSDSENETQDGRRAFWSGTLSFGLVSIPVELLPANRAGGAPLHLVAGDGTPLQRRYFCPEHDVALENDELTHGYELDDGKVVVLTDEELEAADPKKSRDIDLRLFVDRATIDPVYFERGYFLAPGEGSGKAYRLLAAVMEKTGRAGIASFVMRDREYLVAIFAEKGLLRGETLRFASEVRKPKDVGLPKASKPESKLVKQFATVIRGLATKRLPTAELTDDHAEAVKTLALTKLKKKEDVVHVEEPSASRPNAQVIDLMAVLKKSLAESGLSKGTKVKAKARTKTAPPAKKRPRKTGRVPRQMKAH